MVSVILFPWAVLKWLGRVTLWLVFWPVGLWRSVVHGRRKHEKRQAELIAKAMREGKP